MGYGVKLTDLKKDVGTKKDTEGPTSNGSPKILGSSGSSAFQPVSKNKEPPKENGRNFFVRSSRKKSMEVLALLNDV